MPVYDYACEACGPFTVLRPMAQFRDPHDCPDCGAECGRAFLTAPGQGINIAMNTWHGVLTPIGPDADFLCIDRGGDGNNLEEHLFAVPWRVEPA